LKSKAIHRRERRERREGIEINDRKAKCKIDFAGSFYSWGFDLNVFSAFSACSVVNTFLGGKDVPD
jgi:hypothetical protein